MRGGLNAMTYVAGIALISALFGFIITKKHILFNADVEITSEYYTYLALIITMTGLNIYLINSDIMSAGASSKLLTNYTMIKLWIGMTMSFALCWMIYIIVAMFRTDG